MNGKCIRIFNGHNFYVICLLLLSEDIFVSLSKEINCWDPNQSDPIKSIHIDNRIIETVTLIDNDRKTLLQEIIKNYL